MNFNILFSMSDTLTFYSTNIILFRQYFEIRSVKPFVISLFADVALAIEGDFDRYTGIVLGILKQAGEVTLLFST